MGQYVQSYKYEIFDPSRFETLTQRIPSYVLVNATVGYSFLGDKIEAGLHVFNLFNDRHRECSFLSSPRYVGAEELGQKIALFVRASL